MAVILQRPTLPTQILFALKSLAGKSTTEFRTAVAYTTLSGCKTLLPELENRTGSTRWRGIPKTVLTSFDFGLTEPAALKYLLAIPRCRVHIATRSGGGVFHPKLYLFSADSRRDLLIGSANLTRSALTVNTEAALLEQSADQATVDAQWNELLASSVSLTPERLREYDAQWRRRPPPFNPDPPVPPLPTPAPGQLTSLEDATASGQVDPLQFENFWVQASMSGGSRSQLELPRGGYRFFFDFRFTHYDSGQHTIGEPPIIVGSRRFTDRKLTWHGHNRMERMNLPTATQGGPSYIGTAVLFRRTASGFELHVTPWNSPLAITWRNASLATGTVFRIGGGGSSRLCGLI